MCDYSLAGVPNRLAAEGESLVMHRFCTGSMGLTQPYDPKPKDRRNFWQWLTAGFEKRTGKAKEVAVCVPPGARLQVSRIPGDLQRRWRVRGDEEVVFVQVGALSNSFRDAVRFFHGAQVLLQDFPSGLPVKVLSLGGEAGVRETVDEDLVVAHRL